MGGLDDMDDFDLLEATIDPNDVRSRTKVMQLEQDILYEEAKILVKQAYRFA